MIPGSTSEVVGKENQEKKKINKMYANEQVPIVDR